MFGAGFGEDHAFREQTIRKAGTLRKNVRSAVRTRDGTKIIPFGLSSERGLTVIRNIAKMFVVGVTEVVFYRGEGGGVPLLDWLDRLPRKAREKCLARLARLEELGHELRRPEADFLRDGIYELRAAYQGVQYRMLYFFSGKGVVVVSHGLVKEKAVPRKEIDRAIERRRKFESDPVSHAFRGED